VVFESVESVVVVPVVVEPVKSVVVFESVESVVLVPVVVEPVKSVVVFESVESVESVVLVAVVVELEREAESAASCNTSSHATRFLRVGGVPTRVIFSSRR